MRESVIVFALPVAWSALVLGCAAEGGGGGWEALSGQTADGGSSSNTGHGTASDAGGPGHATDDGGGGNGGGSSSGGGNGSGSGSGGSGSGSGGAGAGENCTGSSQYGTPNGRHACDPSDPSVGLSDLTDAGGGPMPPWQGGGSGPAAGATPTSCGLAPDGNYGYQDNDTFCQYVIGHFAYFQRSECQAPDAPLNIDSSLAAAAQAEADRVAGGGCPMGDEICGLDVYNMYYMSPGYRVAPSIQPLDTMVTAAETMLITYTNLYTAPDGGYIPTRACEFSEHMMNYGLYHNCRFAADPSATKETLPTRVGCGTTVDTSGVTWRVVKVGP